MFRTVLMDTAMAAHEPDARLTREQAAQALTDAGYPTSASTLSTKAVRGGGPKFLKFGPRVLYRWADLQEWAEGKTSAPRRTTSEPISFTA